MKILVSTIVLTLISSFAFAQGFTTETSEVETFLMDHEVERVTNYCINGQLNCRSLIQYKDKTTGLTVDSFEDRFMASTDTRSVASRSFFLEKSNGKYKIYAQDLFKNDIEITKVDPNNQNIDVTFDSNHYPTYSVVFFKVGTNETLNATLEFRQNTAEFTGDIVGVWVLKP